MSKRILISVGVIGVVATIVIGATTAYFSDVETSQDNTFSAGSLDLQVVFPYEGEPYPGFPPTKTYNGENIPGVEIKDIKPGDSGFLRYHVNNIGTIGGELYITLANVSNSPGVTPEPEPLPDNGELGENLLINIWYGDESEYPNYSKHIVKDKKLNDLSNVRYLLGDLTAEGDPATTDGKDVYIKWELPSGVGNEVQGDVVSFDIDLDLMQKGETLDGLMGWWKFDEGTGDVAYDSSGYGNDGTIHGAVWSTGKIGGALSFDGVDDYVDCGNGASLNPGEELTIELWVKPNDVTHYGRWVSKFGSWPSYYGYSFLQTYDNALFQLYAGGALTEFVVPDIITAGEWQHMVAVYDGSNMYIYRNGVLQGSQSKTGAITNSGVPLFIGQRAGSQWFNGLIDEVRIYNRALTPAEIWQNYQAGL